MDKGVDELNTHRLKRSHLLPVSLTTGAKYLRETTGR